MRQSSRPAHRATSASAAQHGPLDVVLWAEHAEVDDAVRAGLGSLVAGHRDLGERGPLRTTKTRRGGTPRRSALSRNDSLVAITAVAVRSVSHSKSRQRAARPVGFADRPARVR